LTVNAQSAEEAPKKEEPNTADLSAQAKVEDFRVEESKAAEA